jgi:hypothetical protein
VDSLPTEDAIEEDMPERDFLADRMEDVEDSDQDRDPIPAPTAIVEDVSQRLVESLILYMICY